MSTEYTLPEKLTVEMIRQAERELRSAARSIPKMVLSHARLMPDGSVVWPGGSWMHAEVFKAMAGESEYQKLVERDKQ